MKPPAMKQKDGANELPDFTQQNLAVRGYGNIDANGVVTNFELISVDLVCNSADQTSWQLIETKS